MSDPFSITTWRNAFTKHGQKFGWGLVVIFSLPLVIGFGWSQFSRGGQSEAAATSANKVIMTVNGQAVTQAQFLSVAQSSRSRSGPGEQFAESQGKIVEQLVTMTVIEQEARKRGIHADDAEVDKTIARIREEQLGAKSSDAEWESFVEHARHMSAREFREEVSKQMLGQALLKHMKEEEKISPEDLKNQSAEVKLQVVLVPTLTSNPFASRQPGMPAPLPEPEALKRAEALRASAEKGADMAALAKANSSDMLTNKKGGATDWKPEYKGGGPGSPFGALGYGKEFDEAVHKTPAGGFTPVVKASSFSKGYIFARVLEKRTNQPKDYDPKKVMEELKDQRANARLNDLLKKLLKQARIEIKDPEKKAYYDVFKVRDGGQKSAMAQMGYGDAGDAPSKAELDRLQQQVDTEFESLYKVRKDDPTIALILVNSLNRKRFDPRLSPQEKDALRDRLIVLYETVLKGVENREYRFTLAGLYHEKKQDDLALKQYEMISKLMAADPPADQNARQAAKAARTRLATSYRDLGKPDFAAKEQQKVAEITKEIDEETRKETERKAAAAKKAQEDARAAAAKKKESTSRKPDTGAQAPGSSAVTGGTLTVPPGGSSTLNTTVPLPAGKAPEPKPGR